MRLCNLKAECQLEVTQRPEQRHTSEADLLSEATYWDRALTSTHGGGLNLSSASLLHSLDRSFKLFFQAQMLPLQDGDGNLLSQRIGRIR